MKQLLIFFLFITGFLQAQDQNDIEKHPYILDLSNVEVYDYTFKTEQGELTVRATNIDWEAMMHLAAANFDLKIILLPEKEALFSLAVAIEVLHHQLESSFFNRPLTYTKFFKKYLTPEEQEYFEEQRKRVSEMEGLAKLSLWRMMFDQAQTTRQYELVADSLISLGYKTPGHDAEDLDAVISAYLGYHYMEKGAYQKAIERFEHCYEIRKKRQDHLTVNYDRLRHCYQQLRQTENIDRLNREVLEIGNLENGFGDYVVTMVFRELAKRDVEAAVNYFEEQFLANLERENRLNDYFWEYPGSLPYPLAIKQAKTDEKRIYWIDRWLKKMEEKAEPTHYRFNVYPVLELMKAYPSLLMERKRMEIFERYGFHEKGLPIWSAKSSYLRSAYSLDERFWFHQVPYGRLLAYSPKLEDKKALLEKWMQQAIRTKNDSIIEASALSIANKLMDYGFVELSGQYFEEYYCKKRLHKAVNAYEWYEKTPYSGKEEYLEQWVHLAKTYANHEVAATIYNHSLIFLENPDDEVRHQRYLQAYEIYKEHLDLEGMRWQLRLILSACKKIALSKRMEHAIELYELSLDQRYSLGLSPLNTIVADVLVGRVEDRKEVKKTIKLLKKWQKKLKKGGIKMQKAFDWAKNNELLLKKEL